MDILMGSEPASQTEESADELCKVRLYEKKRIN